jgi:hypothetical protein
MNVVAAEGTTIENLCNEILKISEKVFDLTKQYFRLIYLILIITLVITVFIVYYYFTFYITNDFCYKDSKNVILSVLGVIVPIISIYLYLYLLGIISEKTRYKNILNNLFMLIKDFLFINIMFFPTLLITALYLSILNFHYDTNIDFPFIGTIFGIFFVPFILSLIGYDILKLYRLFKKSSLDDSSKQNSNKILTFLIGFIFMALTGSLIYFLKFVISLLMNLYLNDSSNSNLSNPNLSNCSSKSFSDVMIVYHIVPIIIIIGLFGLLIFHSLTPERFDKLFKQAQTLAVNNTPQHGGSKRKSKRK